MKSFLSKALFYIIVMTGCTGFAQVIHLNDQWQFRTGDDPNWANPSYDTSQWETISAAKNWSEQGYKGYSGIAWYRKTVTLPQEINDEPWGFLLSRTVDAYEVYINGQKLGETGPFGPLPPHSYPRMFRIPPEFIQAGEKIELAVRVWRYDFFSSYVEDWGGISDGVCYLGSYDDLEMKRLHSWNLFSNLNGAWKFSFGDDLRWAEPNFNDQHWSEITSVGGWKKNGLENRSGYAWYRTTLNFGLTQEDYKKKMDTMTVYFEYVSQAFEVYLGGRFAGTEGVMGKNGRKVQKASYFIIKPSDLSKDGNLTIAIRVWRSPKLKLLDPYNSGIINGVHIASEDNARYAQEIRINKKKGNALVYTMSGLMLILLSFYHIISYRFRPEMREHLAFSLVTFFLGTFYFLFLLKPWSPVTIFYLEMTLLSLTIFSFIELCLLYFIHKRKFWIKCYQAAILLYALSNLLIFSFEIGIYPNYLQTILWCSSIVVAVVIIFKSKINSTEMKILAKGLMIMGIPLCWMMLIDTGILPQPSFETAYIPLSTVLILLTFFEISLAYRFASNAKELDLLNQDLETRVLSRTSELKQANEQLTILDKIKTEQMHQLEAQEKRLASELAIASKAQNALLPKELPTYPGYSFAAFSETARECGGDYYDFLELRDGQLLMVIGDVSGKGMKAALYMTMTKGLVSAHAHPDNHKALQRINRDFYKSSSRNMFMSLIYLVLDRETGQITSSNAGHEPIIIKRNIGEIISLKQKGLALGLNSGKLFDKIIEQQTLQLAPGDMIFMYTDGLNEAFNHKGECFGQERILEIIKAAQNPSQLIEDMNGAVHKFTKGLEPHDDLTMLAFQREKETHRDPG